MKCFFLNCINDIVKRKKENKVKHLLKFILAKQRDGLLHDEDVVYPLSALCSFLHELRGQHWRRDGRPQGAGGPTPPATPQYKRPPTRPPTRSPPPPTAPPFLRASQLHVRSFVEALLKQFHAKGDASEEAIRSCTYLLNALCLLDYDGQEKHSRELLSRVVNSFVRLNRRHLTHVGRSDRRGEAPEGTPTQMGGVTTTQKDPLNRQISSQTLVETLTVINKHSVKLKSSNEHLDLLSVFYVEVVNYLFGATALCVTPPVERHHRDEQSRGEADPLPLIVMTSHIAPHRVDLKRIRRFYSGAHLDVHHFVSIALFVKRHAEALRRFAQKAAANAASDANAADAADDDGGGHPVSCDHLRRALSTTTVHIYVNLFWNPQGGSPHGRQHICDEDTHVGRTPSPNLQKGATSYAHREVNPPPQGHPPRDPPNGSSHFLSMWSYFPGEFTKLCKSNQISTHFVVRQNVMNMFRCLKMLSLSVLATDSVTCDHFNRRIYSHVVSFKTFLSLISGGGFPKRDALLSAFDVYCHFWDFLVKFYSSVIYTNSLVCLLGCFCVGRVRGMQRRGLDSPIRVINTEVLRRWGRSGSNYADGPSMEQPSTRGITPESDYPHGPPLQRSNQECPAPLLANQRHLFNMCSFYAQMNFHDEAFTKQLAKMITHNLTGMGRKDIMAVVYLLGKAPPTQGEMLLLLVRQIQRDITSYDMGDFHLALKTVLRYSHQKEWASSFTAHAETILQHVIVRLLLACSEMETKKKQPVQRTTPPVQQTNPPTQQTTPPVRQTTATPSISQEEMQTVYAKLRRRPTWFTSHTEMLARGEKSPFLRDTLNVLNVAVKLGESGRLPHSGDGNRHLYEAGCRSLCESRCPPLCDALYLLIKRTKNPRDCFSVPEWVSLILCHCKLGHAPDYLHEYLAHLHGKIHEEVNREINGKLTPQLRGVHLKNLRLIRMLSHRLKSLRLNGELFAPFCARGEGSAIQGEPP
ncbi:hypothetical protein PVNG_04311 [Plasmodium vivax North Korean]|uniref:Uncharacterized protein n=1 Tax=Plasmodium vivax North Korean TaxID=1035514 RepID=A0A0J9TW82_PLAVI|nr:hypothetical protein PVNG_04311 [Plasmodium vivax North Korean]